MPLCGQNKEDNTLKNKKITKIILHIPHSSTFIPHEFSKSFLCDVSREMTLMTDLYTNELFDCRHDAVVFPLSRLICDVERFRNDSNEFMSTKGMGAIYTNTQDGSPLRAIGENEKETILRRFYDPHHAYFEDQVSKRLRAFKKCLIIDCHSFPAEPLPYESDKSPDRPDICIGTDDFHTPEKIRDRAVDAFSSLGYSVKINSPFSGAIVPMRFYRRDCRVASIMIEVNRSLYIDGKAKTSGFGKLKLDIASVIAAINEVFY